MAFSNTHTLIAKGTKLVGDLYFSGDLQVEGEILGNIIAEQSADAKVVIADKGAVTGEIHAPTVVINGVVRGDVHSAKHIELAAKAQVYGNVYYKLIEMVKGSQVNGSLVFNEQADGAEAKAQLAGKTSRTPNRETPAGASEKATS